jgi:hypothetical protein
MLTPDQSQFTRLDLSGPYAKLARHITAMYEIVRLAPTNDPSQPGSPSCGLSARDRMGVTEHLRACLEMISTLEKWMMDPVAVIPAPGARPDRPEGYLDPEHVRKQREMHDRLHTYYGDDADESRLLGR